MSTLFEIKERIRVVKNIHTTTKVTQMISLSKMNKIRNRITVIKESIKDIDILFQDALKSFYIKNKLSTSGDEFVQIVFGSDVGFCGATNSSLLKKINPSEKGVNFIIFGRKIFNVLSKKHIKFYQTDLDFFLLESQNIRIEIDKLCEKLFEDLKKNKYKHIKLCYLNFKSISYSDYCEEIILDNIDLSRESFIKFYLRSKILYAYISTFGTILANRIKSMESSTQNAEKIFDYLTLHYNKTRQAKINIELLDIISGS